MGLARSGSEPLELSLKFERRIDCRLSTVDSLTGARSLDRVVSWIRARTGNGIESNGILACQLGIEIKM